MASIFEQFGFTLKPKKIKPEPKYRRTTPPQIGEVKNNRRIISSELRKVSGTRNKTFFLVECLTCKTQKWLTGWKWDQFECQKCSGIKRRTAFCKSCGEYRLHGLGPSKLCKNCYVPPYVWGVETWLRDGRLYSHLKRPRRSSTRKDPVREFLHKEQNGLCAMCKLPLEIQGSHIEHNHETDVVRGLTHAGCNHLIGAFELKHLPAPVSVLLPRLSEYLNIST